MTQALTPRAACAGPLNEVRGVPGGLSATRKLLKGKQNQGVRADVFQVAGSESP